MKIFEQLSIQNLVFGPRLLVSFNGFYGISILVDSILVDSNLVDSNLVDSILVDSSLLF